MNLFAFKMDFGITQFPKFIKWRINYKKESITHLSTFGTCVFCGPQGSGKTLSAVQYAEAVFRMSPRSILVTNVSLSSFPFNAYMSDNGDIRYISSDRYCGQDFIGLHYMDDNFKKPVIQYDGLDMLTKLKNGKYGVIYLIDEFHLEMNSLESKNVPIEIMTEISQQRKQKVHIIGTSQVAMRLAKPLREQLANVIICKNYFNFLQVNKMCLGEDITEKDGKMNATIKARSIWLHQPRYYNEYDTYAKMKRYSKIWKNSTKGVNSIYDTNERNN